MLDWLIEPLKFEFMRNALGIGILLGILCAVVGSYMVVQQMGMMAHAVSHSLMAGLPVAYVMGVSLSIGALSGGLISALFMVWIESRSKVKADSALAIMLSFFLAIGVTLVRVLPGANSIDLVHVLFGDILGVTGSDLWMILGVTITMIILAKLFYKELLFYTFDPIGAQAMGMPVHWYYTALITAMTVTIVINLEAVGALMVIAMLVGPAVAAYLLVKELYLMMVLGSIFGAVSSVAGMYLSYYMNVPSGAAIVMFACGFFLLAFSSAPPTVLLWR
ncbi:MAG: metal ABC transporter permease [Synechococcaceae cyanobacterium SM2_3_1]|nr:metal ABC transporter permease [Synechococcaceae cyanobacterium SM2_3_1]